MCRWDDAICGTTAAAANPNKYNIFSHFYHLPKKTDKELRFPFVCHLNILGKSFLSESLRHKTNLLIVSEVPARRL